MASRPQRAAPDPAPETATPPVSRINAPARPFLGVIDSILVNDPAEFTFEGSVTHADAAAAWTWMVHAVGPDLIGLEGAQPERLEAFDKAVPELLARARKRLAEAATSQDIELRIRAHLGNETGWDRLPTVLLALKCRLALGKAEAFGRAANGIQDEASLAVALQSMPLQDAAVAALLMHAAVGYVANPAKLVTAAIRLAGAASELALARAGLAPLIDAVLAHAQSQIPLVAGSGAFADFDLICRAVDRFHRLVRAINYVEFSRSSRWGSVLATLTKAISQRLEPRLRDAPAQINRAMRRGRDGADRIDEDLLLAALNGTYLLATVRECRDSLAVNAVFDQAWTQVGQSLEVHLERNLDLVRRNPANAATSGRLDACIKMAELRFGAEYGEILRRARDSAERRTTS
jgi:hypothetical protein